MHYPRVLTLSLPYLQIFIRMIREVLVRQIFMSVSTEHLYLEIVLSNVVLHIGIVSAIR